MNMAHYNSYKFKFMKLPLFLINDPPFSEMSIEAKFIYSEMLNLTNFSKERGLIDRDGRLYINYCPLKTAEKTGWYVCDINSWIDELVEYELVEYNRKSDISGTAYPKFPLEYAE